MIYTVTFNPSLDYILDLTEFERNQVNRTTGEKILPGGKGINVSIVLQNLGIDNRAICFTSGFTVCVFGAPPNAVEHPQKIFVFVASST